MPFDLLITDKTPRTLLSQADLFDKCPAAFNKAPAPTVTSKYDFVDTMGAVEILQDNGFKPVYAQQKPSRKSQNIPFASHLIAFAQDLEDNPHRPEILLWNSSDGSQSLRLLSGIFRFACDNGIVCGEGLQAKFRHIGGKTAGFENLVQEQAKNMPKAMAKVEAMQEIQLSTIEQKDLARQALGLRWKSTIDVAKSFSNNWLETADYLETASGSFFDGATISQALRAKRVEDTPQDLWTVYNRLQESILQGGVSLVSCTKKGIKSRQAKAVQSLKETVRLNQGLWDLAEKVAA